VDGTMVGANASRQSRVPREQLQEAAQVSQTVQEYLAGLEQANPVVDTEMVSATDPDAVWATITRAGDDGLLRQLSHQYLQSSNSRGGSYAGRCERIGQGGPDAVRYDLVTAWTFSALTACGRLPLCTMVTGSRNIRTLESAFALARMAIRSASGKGSDNSSNSSP
jgi:hypothetical protein